MYARVTKFVLGPNSHDRAREITDFFDGLFRTCNGFYGVTFFGDADSGEFGAFSLWACKEDAEASLPFMRSLLSRVLGADYVCGPISQQYEVYLPSRDRQRQG